MLSSEFRETHRNGDCLPLRTGQTHRNATLRGRLSVSNFLYRHELLYGSILELCNCLHRIQSLWKLGYIRPAEIGPVYQQSPVPGFLVRNTRSQGRSLGIQKLLSDSPWMTTEDCAIFLLGWDRAEEWRARDHCDTQDSTLCSYVLRFCFRIVSALCISLAAMNVHSSTRGRG